MHAALARMEEWDRLLAAGEPRSLVGRLLESALVVVTGLWLFELYWRLRDGRQLTGREALEKWFTESAQEGDELWEYHSGAESWEMMGGECGYAIRRDGLVVDYWMIANN